MCAVKGDVPSSQPQRFSRTSSATETLVSKKTVRCLLASTRPASGIEYAALHVGVTVLRSFSRHRTGFAWQQNATFHL